ncbi:MAG: O-acetylhomoserine aminocarboxypropyltransferase/cysteine synthase family protein [Candidatus Bipolaricaulota bacterium]
MNYEKETRLDTLSVHAGQEPDQETKSRAAPIYQTASYLFDDADQAADLFALRKQGNIYTRMMNPTNEVFEERMTALEGGVGAVATTSGMSALNLIVFTLAENGENVVSSPNLYGGTYTYFTHTLPRYGIPVKFVDGEDPASFAEAVDDNTKFIHVETISNPSLRVPDLKKIAEVAHQSNIPLVVDNTFATPCLCRPFDYGADIIWHSTTKWLNGHGTTIGGVVIDSGNFDWKEGQFTNLTEPDPSYHGVNFTERFGDEAFIQNLRARGLRDLGGNQSPFDSFLNLQGLETLPLRMEKHCRNALEIATYLQEHPKIKWVTYPGLKNHPTHQTASDYLDGGFGGIITFGVEGGYEAGKTVIESVELISFLANVGDAKSLIIHPSSTTHQQMSAEEKESAGITDDMLRFSVGIENPADIQADLSQALARI